MRAFGIKPLALGPTLLAGALTLSLLILPIIVITTQEALRAVPQSRLALLLMLAWTGVYLVLPVYSGGFVWHINLVVVGYSVLFGMAIAGLLDAGRLGLRAGASGLDLSERARD